MPPRATARAVARTERHRVRDAEPGPHDAGRVVGDEVLVEMVEHVLRRRARREHVDEPEQAGLEVRTLRRPGEQARVDVDRVAGALRGPGPSSPSGCWRARSSTSFSSGVTMSIGRLPLRSLALASRVSRDEFYPDSEVREAHLEVRLFETAVDLEQLAGDEAPRPATRGRARQRDVLGLARAASAACAAPSRRGSRRSRGRSRARTSRSSRRRCVHPHLRREVGGHQPRHVGQRGLGRAVRDEAAIAQAARWRTRC